MGHSYVSGPTKRLTMKRTFYIFCLTLLGAPCCAMNNPDSTKEQLEKQMRSSIELVRRESRAEQSNEKSTLSTAQTAVRYCHFAGSSAALLGAALHTKILPTTKTGLFACLIGGAAALNLSTRFLRLFFNYQNQSPTAHPKIPAWKAYSCLIGSLAVPATIAAGLYGISQPQTLAHL